MLFDTNNAIVKLCAQGMMLEGEGKNEEAAVLFQQSWTESSDDFEKFIAAHYVARHQKNIADKLKWDLTALEHALKVRDQNVSSMYPSLYLNIAKCYEDLNDFVNARENYHRAFTYADNLSQDGYGEMIKKGILSGMDRVK